MNKSKTIIHGLGHGALALLYIYMVPQVMMRLGKVFSGPDSASNGVGPAVFLLVLVISAALMGLLVFGRPVMLYMDGKRREALVFFASTLGFLIISVLLVIATLTS